MSTYALLEYAALAIAATAVIWKGSELLESSSEALSKHYGLPPIVHGAVVVAVGSSFPELSAAVISTLRYGEFELGVGAIVGSAVFNILVIPALSGLASTDSLDANRDLVYKEAQFYMLSVAVLLITFSMAVIYYPATGTPDSLLGTVTRPLALIPVGLYVLYIFIQYQDAADHEATDDPIEGSTLKQWGLLIASLAVIVVAVEGMVHAARGFGDLFDTPGFIWGLTVIAAGTSLPDTLVSVRAARANRSTTSLANVLGSNIFDLLIAVPAGVMLAGSTVVDFAVAVPMMAVLTLATVLLFTVMRTDLRLSTAESAGLIGSYGLFLLWLVLETIGTTSVLPV